MTARRRTKDSSGGGFAVLLVLGATAWLIMFIVRHIWVILGILVVVASVYLAKAIVQENRRRRDAYARYCADVAAKADQQDHWVAVGDERGIYGTGAVDLMRYIRSGGKTPLPNTASASTVVVPTPLSPARQAAAPAVVAGGVGIALMLAQIPGPGSEQAPSSPAPTRTTTPSASRTPWPTTATPSPLPSITSTPSPTRTAEPVPSYVPPTTASVPPPTTAEPVPVYQPVPQSSYYRNCSQAHADGRYNIPQGDPAYRPGLDRDRDGFACE